MYSELHRYVFRNSDPEQAWDIYQKAMKASKILRDDIRAKIPRPKWLQPSVINLFCFPVFCLIFAVSSLVALVPNLH
jgi:hypothetical protein